MSLFGKSHTLNLCWYSKLRAACRFILFFPNEKPLPYIKLLVTSLRPPSSQPGGMSAGLLAFHWNLQETSWKTPVLWDVWIDLKGWNAGHYLFRWKNTKLCMLFSSDQTKKIPKNVLHVWLSELNCCISNIKAWGETSQLWGQWQFYL